MTPIVQPLGLHIAYLDPFTGTGLLVCPPEANNVYLFGRSANEADWDAAMRHLLQMGWEPLYDDGQVILEGHTPEGCPVVALYGSQSICSEPDIPALVEAHACLMVAAGCACV